MHYPNKMTSAFHFVPTLRAAVRSDCSCGSNRSPTVAPHLASLVRRARLATHCRDRQPTHLPCSFPSSALRRKVACRASKEVATGEKAPASLASKPQLSSSPADSEKTDAVENESQGMSSEGQTKLETAEGRAEGGEQAQAVEAAGNATVGGSVALGGLVVVTLVGIGGLSVVYKEQLNDAVLYFSNYLEGAGPWGYVAFLLGYAGLEVLAIPAIPITMSAGLLFGPMVGTALVSTSGTIAATAAFLIARYLARDRILELVKDNKKYLAIDKAIEQDSFRVVTLLRLSPLLPFSLGNYVYGLTSVKLLPYVLGSWLGMLPGTWAYVSAGALGRSILNPDSSQEVLGGSSLYTLGAGLLATVAAAAYVTRLAKNAIQDLNLDDDPSSSK